MACYNRYRWLEVAMKENPKLKEVVIKKDNFVNDDKLARQIIEAQEKWDLDYKSGISCAKKEGITEEKIQEQISIAKKLLKMNIDIETISKATELTKDKLLKLKQKTV